jgi:predicted outer membrane protein
MKPTRMRIAGLLGGGLALALVATAQGATHHSDKSFEQHVLSKMHEVNQMEIAMRQAHEASDKKVTSLAHKEGIHLVATTPMNAEERRQVEADRRAHQDLTAAHGADFDRQYMQAMDQGHASVARILTQARANLHDGRAHALVSQTIPVVQHHQRMAEDVIRSL